MNGPRWNDPREGYRAWIDVASWVDYFLISELSNNPDSFFKSLYFVKARDSGGQRGKLGLHPFWDYNIAYGNADFREAYSAFREKRKPAYTGSLDLEIGGGAAAAADPERR